MLNINSEANLIGSQIGYYTCSDLLGKGAFGSVYKGFNRKTNTLVALKVINKAQIEKQKSQYVRQVKKRLIKSESEIMMKCNSPHVVKCYDRFQNNNLIIFVIQFCNDGDLSQQLKKRKTIPQDQARIILKHIISGFAELHKNNIVHRDLKCDNIFKHNEKYKIGDLGFAKILPNLMEVSQMTTLGTLNTMAPQVMMQSQYGIKADLWSLGIIYFQMLFGYSPYKVQGKQNMLRNFNSKLWIPKTQNCSEDSRDLISKLLVVSPQKRMNWKEIYDHPVFIKHQSAIFDEFQQDIDLFVSRAIHFKLEQSNKNYNIEDDIDAADKLEDLELPKLLIEQQNLEAIQKDRNAVQKIDSIEKSILRYIQELNFHKQRSQLIFQNIVSVIQNEGIPVVKSLFLSQLQYLVICQCFFIVSPINNALTQKLNIFKWQYYEQFLSNNLSSSFLKDFKDHYKLINQTKSKIQNQLFKEENRKRHKLLNFYDKLVNNQKFKEKQKFLAGIFRTDFTLDQQVDYTVNNYIGKFIDELSQNSEDVAKKMIRFFREDYVGLNTAVFPKSKDYVKAAILKYSN